MRVLLKVAGIIGFSQGGAGAINAVTRFENGSTYKALYTGSAAFSQLAAAMGWEYDASGISIPWFMCAGTGSSDDSGSYAEGEYAGIAPLFSLRQNYEAAAGAPKVLARAVGAEHEEVLVRSDGYLTAWMLWQLAGDEEAAQVFVGDDAEILLNPAWQDVEKSV